MLARALPSASVLSLVLGFAFSLLPLAAQAPPEVRLTVAVQDTSGFKKSGDLWVPAGDCLDLSNGQSSGVEAESPDEVLWMPGGGVQRDPASAVTFVKGYSLLRYYYYADQKAPAALWALIRHDKHVCAYAWGHQYSSEREFTAAGADPAARLKEVAGQWRWVKLVGFNLEPGFRSLQLVYSWPGSPEIDKVAVLHGDATPETANLAPRRVRVGEYWLQSEEVNLPAATHLVGAQVLADRGGAPVEASGDGGQTWQPADNLPLTGPFRLRARLAPASVAGAKIRGFQASLRLDNTRALVADNGKVRLVVDTAAGGVFRLDSSALARTFAAPTAALPLFSLELKERGKPWPDPRKWIGPADGKLTSARLTGSPAAPGVELVYSLLDGQLTATVGLALGSGLESTWTLALDNRSTWDLLTFNFPRLGGLRVGWSGYDDRWLNTNRYGPWMAGASPEDRPYPGWGALGFVDLYDDAGGLALATHDPEDGITDPKLRPTAPRASDSCTLEASKLHSVPAGEKRTWTWSVLLHNGDWHAAADWYGAWFRQRFGLADHWPEWMRDSNGWLQTSCALTDSRSKWSQLLDLFEDARRLGMSHLQVWGQFGSSTCASFWWPSPKYGSIQEFAATNRRIRDQGGHIGYYLMYCLENRYNQLDTQTYEGYLPRTAYPPGVPILGKDKLISGCAVDDPTGKITAWPTTDQEMAEFQANLARLLAEGKTTTWAESKTWPKASMAGMNPLDQDWQQWLRLWTVDLYLKQWNADTPYQDVLGAGNADRSFDLRRGDSGQVHNGERVIARQLWEAGHAADPDYCLIAEGKQEQVTRWAVGMTSASHYGWIDLAAHRYTHPDHILVMGASNGGYTQLVKNFELAVLYGARFDTILTGDIRSLRRLINFREGFKRFTFRADYRDTAGLQVEGEGLQATRHERLRDGCRSVLVTVLNDSARTDGKLSVDTTALGEGLYGAYWLKDDWQPTRATLKVGEKGWVSTTVPAHRLSALLLVAQAPAAETVLAGLSPVPVPGGYAAQLWVANLTPEARKLNLSLEGPGAPVPVTADLLPWGLYTRTVTAQLPLDASAEGFVRLLLDAKPLASGYLYAPIADPSFEKDGTAAPDAAQGQRLARLGPQQGWQGTMRLLNVEPGRTYHLSVAARRTGDQGNMYVFVRLMDGAGKWQYTRLDFPPGVFGQWVRLEGNFTVPAPVKDTDVYLYNMDTQATVDYDDIRLTMTG